MTHEYDWVIGQEARIQTDTGEEVSGTIVDVRTESGPDTEEQVRVVLETAEGELDIDHQRVKLA